MVALSADHVFLLSSALRFEGTVERQHPLDGGLRSVASLRCVGAAERMTCILAP